MTFNKPLNPATVIDPNLRLRNIDTYVTGTLSYNTATYKITFQPPRPLNLLSTYTVEAGVNLRDLSGNGLATPQSWTFKTADGAWQAPQRQSSTTALASDPYVQMDDEGNAIAVWEADVTSTVYEIRAARYTPSAGWGSVTTVSTPGNYFAAFPVVKFDGQGNALAVWTQNGGTPVGTGGSVWAARYIKGGGWQAPVVVDSGLEGIRHASLAMDASGNAIAVWAKPIVFGLPIPTPDAYAARFTVAGGWETPTRLGSAASLGSNDVAEDPQVAMDGAGNAVAAWTQSPATTASVWSARYQVGSGWQAAVPIHDINGAGTARLAVSPAGQAVLIWGMYISYASPPRTDLWTSNLSTPGATWTTPTLLETGDGGSAFQHSVVADTSGGFHAIWRQSLSDYFSDIVSRKFSPGTGWGTTTTLSVSTNTTYYQNRTPSIAADRSGNLMVIWGNDENGAPGAVEGTIARRFIAGTGWQPPIRINAGTIGRNTNGTSLAVSPDGTLMGIWIEPQPSEGAGVVWTGVLK